MYNSKTTEWDNIKIFVNSNVKFTRKDLYAYGFSNTGEQYLLQLKHIGFVNKAFAKYDRLCKIPESLSSTKMSKLARNKSDCLKYIRTIKLKNIKTLYNL